MPEPPAPEMCRPVRKVVKMARPAAVSMAFCGIFTRAFCFPLGPWPLSGVDVVVVVVVV
jgi:hypothetical protein